MIVNLGDSYVPYIGYDETNAKSLFLREIFKGSDHTTGPVKVLLYRPGAVDAKKASINIAPLTAKAKYNGVRGNDISVAIIADPDQEGSFTVQTVVDGAVKDRQMAKKVEDLQENDWVSFRALVHWLQVQARR